MGRLRDDLELKLNILSLPIDTCVQHAVRGNTARLCLLRLRTIIRSHWLNFTNRILVICSSCMFTCVYDSDNPHHVVLPVAISGSGLKVFLFCHVQRALQDPQGAVE